MSNTFSMKLDPTLKDEFGTVAESYGLTIAQAFKLFAHQTVRTGSLALSFDYNQKIPNATTTQALQEAIDSRATAKRYDSMDEMMADFL